MGADTPTPTRGVPVMLDRQRHLRFSLKAMREMREKFGIDALKGGGFDQNSIAELLWFGLKGEDPDLTVEMVEEMVDLEHLGEVMEAVSIATGTQDLVQVEEEKAEEKQDASPPPDPAPTTTDTEKPKSGGSGKDASSPKKKPPLSKVS